MFRIISKEPKNDAQNTTCRKLDNIESSRMFTFHIQQRLKSGSSKASPLFPYMQPVSSKNY
jgi:hypothetical protein